MDKLIMLLGTVLSFGLIYKVYCIPSDYLKMKCNVSAVYLATSLRLESSTALYYDSLMSCYYSVYVDSGKTVQLLVRYFDLESKVKSSCVDYVNIHDGSTTTATTLNTNPLCAKDNAAKYEASGNAMTIYFKTDATGARQGFDFIFVAITKAPCSSAQFACNNSICIDSELKCNIYNECGDNSDEDSCTYTEPTKVKLTTGSRLAIGLSIGLFIVVVIGIVLVLTIWHKCKWRLYLKRPILAKEVVHEETSYTTTYPLTKVYYKEKFQSMYKDPTKLQAVSYETIGANPTDTESSDNGKHRDI